MPSFDLQDLKQSGFGEVVYRATMPSTSDVAKASLQGENRGHASPLLVICDQQTAGRGQRGKLWQSSAQSLTFTWCVAADRIPPNHRPLLPLIAGASVCEAVAALGGKRAKLKWPNDVLVGGKKVCGILVEKISARSQPWFLIGTGINVNQTRSELESWTEPGSAFPPGSLRADAGCEVEMQGLLCAVMRRLAANVEREIYWSDCLEAHFEFLDQTIQLSTPGGEELRGTFRGVDQTGRLKLEMEGQIHSFASGRVSI